MPAKLTQNQFIKKAIQKHNGFYDYSLVKYIKAQTKVKIICPIHGIFEQQPNNHLFRQRCVYCMGDNVRKARKFTTEQWIEKFKDKHGNRYDYSKVKEFKGSGMLTKIIIICKKHGEFLQRPQTHLQGANCPYCNISKGEDEIEKYLIKNDIEYVREYKFDKCINPKTNKKLPFDFFLLKYNMVIEYHGEQHYKKTGHFEQRAGGLEDLQYRDKIKEEFCLQNNILYIEISYKEFENIDKILKEKICVLDLQVHKALAKAH
jgi:hypothetical protein